MGDIILMERTKELEQFSQELGLEKAFFLEDVSLISSVNKKEVLHQVQEAERKKKLTIYQVADEEMLRFVLEKTNMDLILGMEKLYSKDSFHYVKSGLDQVLCTMAKEKDKVIAFSFADILNAINRPQLLARIMFNIKLCRKYKVKMFWGSFAREKMELRSAQDLEAFWRVLGGERIKDTVVKIPPHF